VIKKYSRFGRIGRGSLNAEEEINPMDGLANLADIMLVLACGLLLALIINWNIDIGESGKGPVSVSQGQEVQNMQGLTNSDSQDSVDYSKYKKMGEVYKDPSTGKLYMVTPGE
jgi:hypothetical protein